MQPIDWKILRLRAGLTQHETGQLIGVASYTISALETGRWTPEPEKAAELRAALEARARHAPHASAEAGTR